MPQVFFCHLFNDFSYNVPHTCGYCFCLAGIFLRKCTRTEQCNQIPGSGNCLSDTSVKFLFLCSKFCPISPSTAIPSARRTARSTSIVTSFMDKNRICIVTVIDHGHSLYMVRYWCAAIGLHRCNARAISRMESSQFFPVNIIFVRCWFFVIPSAPEPEIFWDSSVSSFFCKLGYFRADNRKTGKIIVA